MLEQNGRDVQRLERISLIRAMSEVRGQNRGAIRESHRPPGYPYHRSQPTSAKPHAILQVDEARDIEEIREI
jgi:hypothetical protein